MGRRRLPEDAFLLCFPESRSDAPSAAYGQPISDRSSATDCRQRLLPAMIWPCSTPSSTSPPCSVLSRPTVLALRWRTRSFPKQLNVLQRSARRPQLEDEDRIFWMLVHQLISDWAEHLVIVKPETVIRWHRKGFAYYWRQRSQGRIGRPPIPMKVIHLIKKLSRENVLWGAPRISDEFLHLGYDVCSTTVAKYMPPRRSDEPNRQKWRTFIADHMPVRAACDFFTVPTLTFKVLYVFVVLSHDRRRRHFNVTTNPTAAWTAHQLVEAFPCGEEPKLLHRDRDAIFGDAFRKTV